MKEAFYNVNFHQLDIFFCTVELESFTKAAAKLHMTQSAVSKSIAKLEQELQIQLFTRHYRELHVTQAGLELYQRWKKPMQEIEKEYEKIWKLQHDEDSQLKVGTTSTTDLNTYFWPIMTQFQQKFPECAVEPDSDNMDRLITKLADGQLDVVFVPDFMKYKNKLYLELAQKMAVYGWILVAVTAASPIVDSSFMEKGVYGKSVFTGLSSVRCSELGYWNEFPPTFDYSDIDSYVNSIEKYVKNGLLKAPSELYYPIRLKPAGENNLISLRKNGINHIELRMFDLNPLTGAGIDARDVKFAQFLMVWLATMPSWYVSKKDQVNAVQNFKNAAHYDLKTVKIARTEKRARSIVHEALKVIGWMKEFYQGLKMDDVQQILDFEYEKFVDPEKRYAWQVRKQYQENYVEKGLVLARQKQNMTV